MDEILMPMRHMEFTQGAAWEKLRRLKLQDRDRSAPKEEKKVKTNIKCYWCEELIEAEHYYKCAQHKHIFCDDCAHNFYHPEIEHWKAPRCKEFPRIDCIHEKVVL